MSNTPNLAAAARALLDAMGGNTPEWIRTEALQLEAALVNPTPEGILVSFSNHCDTSAWLKLNSGNVIKVNDTTDYVIQASVTDALYVKPCDESGDALRPDEAAVKLPWQEIESIHIY